METPTNDNLLLQIEELQNRLAEGDQIIEAIKAGEVDAFAFNKNNQTEVFTLQSGDYAYRVLVENFSEGALNVSEDGLIVYTNKSFHETLTLPYKEVIGQNIFTFIHPDSKEAFSALLKKGLAGHSKGEINLIAGKESFPVYVSLTSLYPNLPTVGVIVINLTERKQALKELESKKSLQNILQNVPAATAVLEGPEHKYILANAAYQKLFNRQAEDFLGKSIHEVFPELKETGAFELVDHVFKTGESFSTPEYPLLVDLCNDSVLRQHFYNFSMEPLQNNSGEIYAVIAMIYDVTEQVVLRKKTEETEKQKAFLLKLSDALRLLGTPQQIKTKATQLLGEHLNVSRCYLAEVMKDGAHCFIDNSFSSGLGTIDGTYRLEDFGKNKVAVLLRGEVIVTGDVANDTSVTQEERDRNLEMQIHAYINVPLLKDNNLIYLLGVNQSVVRNWTALDLIIIQETAVRTWVAIEHAKAEESLRISEEKYRTLFTSIDQGFTLCELIRNKEGKGVDLSLLEVNPTYEKQTGITKEMVLGKPLLQVFPSLGNMIELYTAVVDNQRPAEFEQYFHDTDRWFVIKAYPVEKEKFVVLFSDITERKKAEEKIIESEKEIRVIKERLELSIQAGKIGIWHWDVNNDILYWSNEQKEMYGFSASEVITSAAQVNDLVIPEDLKRIQDDQSAGNKLELEYDFRINRKNDGELRWIKSRARNIVDEQGALQFITGVNIDITEQTIALDKIKVSESAIVQQKQLLESVMANTDMALFLMDEKQHCIYMNHSAEIMTGFTMEEMKGKQLHYYVHHSYPDGSAFPLEKCPIDKALPSYNKMKGEEVFVHKDGSFYPVAFTASPIIHNGNAIGTVLEVRNTTEEKKKEQVLKESEKRFRNLAENLPQMVWVMNGDGSMEYVSKNWKDYTGIDEVAEAWNYTMHPDDREGLTTYWNHVFAQGKGYHHEVRLKNKEGIYRWFYSVGEPVLDADGKVSKWVGSLTDIHEQKINDEKKDEFISIASHEMKTPLTTAKAYLQMLELTVDKSDEDVKLYVKKANQSVNRLNELICELLDVSKIRLGKLNYNISTFNFNEMLESTVENLQLTSPTHKIIKTGKVNDEVTGDKERLQQVLINILTNAIKYSPDAEKVFIIVEQEIDVIKVSVKDTGIGMAQQNLDKIFEKYHRVEENAVQFQGLGIGLFISYDIIQRHNGKLWAESEPGVGSTFYFTLPVNNVKQGQLINATAEMI